jgi:hypothetical protein
MVPVMVASESFVSFPKGTARRLAHLNCVCDITLPDALASHLGAPASLVVDTLAMTLRGVSWLLLIVGSMLPLAGSGCSNSTKASSPDAAADAAISSGGTSSGGVLGTGGGSGGSSGKGGGGAPSGGAGGTGGMTTTGGTTGSSGSMNSGGKTGSGGTMNSGGAMGPGGTTSTSGVTGLGGTMSSGGVSGHSGAADGGDRDSPAAIGIDGGSGADGAVDGGAEPHCVGTPSRCPQYSSGSCPPGCYYHAGNYCEGTPHSCSSNTTATACVAQAGCTWSDATPACTGKSAATCSIDTDRDRCLAAGCQYTAMDPTCSGAPTPCSQLSAANCYSQPGCTVSTL